MAMELIRYANKYFNIRIARNRKNDPELRTRFNPPTLNCSNNPVNGGVSLKPSFSYQVSRIFPIRSRFANWITKILNAWTLGGNYT